MFLSADKIHNGKNWLPENTTIEITDDGTIIAIHNNQKFANTQHYAGIICPGFVNTHCHIELSHLKGAVAQHTGLTSFLTNVMRKRNNFTEEEKKAARENAVQTLIENGIVAVGDIANTTDTLLLRERDGFHWQTFVECIGFNPEKAEVNFEFSEKIYKQFAQQKKKKNQLSQSIVPHAPYSVSEQLFTLIAAHQKENILSIHNQESAAENELYQNKSGAFISFFKEIGIDDSSFAASSKSSLKTYADWLSADTPTILVHNTFSKKEDILFAESKFKKLFWCLCPNANLYIENQLPNIELLNQFAQNICIGTDSLASNHQLSVMSELQTIDQHFPTIGWEQLLRWATYNGACALKMENQIGSIEPNKKPSLVLIKKDFSIEKLY